MTRAPQLSKKAAHAALLLSLTVITGSTDVHEDSQYEPDQRNLFRDDENFWSRFVQEVTSSSFTPQPTPDPTPGPTPNPTPNPTPKPTPGPTPGPTPEPTPGPTNEPSASPTDYCEAEVRRFRFLNFITPYAFV